MSYGVIVPIHQSTLDGDQTAALQRFIADLNEVLARGSVPAGYCSRLIRGLAAAYSAALAAGSWMFFIALLSSALDDLVDAGYAPHASAAAEYWRLRAMVRENADLLPPEMRTPA